MGLMRSFLSLRGQGHMTHNTLKKNTQRYIRADSTEATPGPGHYNGACSAANINKQFPMTYLYFLSNLATYNVWGKQGPRSTLLGVCKTLLHMQK